MHTQIQSISQYIIISNAYSSEYKKNDLK